MSFAKKIAFYAMAFLLCYGILEALFSSAYFLGLLEPQKKWANERTDPAGNFQYHQELGHILSPTPTKIGYWTSSHGWVATATIKGNNYGFRDEKPFFPQKPSGVKRVIILGDSMTAGIYLERPWPRIAEELLANEKVEIYNLAVDGVGMADWWRISKNILIKENFDFDILIVASCCDNLSRTFFWRRDDGEYLKIHYEGSFEPKEINSPLEIEGYLIKDWLVLEPGEIERMQKEWFNLGSFLKMRTFSFYLYHKIKMLIGRLFEDRENDGPSKRPIAPRYMFDDIKKMVQTQKADLYVVSIASMQEDIEVLEERLAPLEVISAEQVFSHDDDRETGLPFDGHWSQYGSQKVGELMAKKIKEWLQKRDRL